MDDIKRKSDKKLPLLTLDDGFSINSNFYPESDSNMIDDDDEIDTMIEADSYQSLDHDDFDCCSHFKEANWFSRVFFFWPSAIIMKGKLSLEILGTIPRDESAYYQKQILEENWSLVQNKKGHALFNTVIKTYKWKLSRLLFFNLIASVCDAVMPFFLREIMSYIEEEDESTDGLPRALIFVSLMIFTLLFARILRENLAFMQLKIGVQASQALTAMVYSKIMRVSSATNKVYKKGDIISFIQVDAPKVTFLFDTLPEVSRVPFLLVFLLISLYVFIGLTFLAAIGIILIFGVINYYIAKWTANIQVDRMKKLDKRTNRISEVIDNIKLIKFNSWIDKFLDKVFKSRSKEIKVIVKKLLMWMINITFMNLNYPILAISVFLVAIFAVKLSVAVPTALAILQILNSLHSSSRSLPLFIGDFVEFLVSMKRIQNFLNCGEIEEDAICHDRNTYDDYSIRVKCMNFFWGFEEKSKKKKKKPAIEGQDQEETKVDMESSSKKTKKINQSSDSSSSEADVSDESDNSDDDEEDDATKQTISDKITLKGVELEIARGEFVAIIGEIGSGKTSIISSLIGDMLAVDDLTMNEYKNYQIFDTRHETNPENEERLLTLNSEVYEKFHKSRRNGILKPGVHIKGSMCLMEQTPWVSNATIRENILFGEPLDESKYNKTIESCQLARDLDILTGGDLTQIGEKGINLSGGQKARIGIARAVYANKDIILMDDPLSALDAHVKKKIFDEVC